MRLSGPPQIVRVRSEEVFRRRVRAVAVRLGVRHEDGAYTARVEHGRWIADCPCGSGVAVHPEWRDAGCLECGRWWPVMVPPHWRDIEDILMARPKALNRGWLAETVEQLEDENERHSVPRRSERRVMAVR